MKLDTIYLKNNSKFAQTLNIWASSLNLSIQEYSDKNDDSDGRIDGLVIFNQNQEIDRDLSELRLHFDKKLKPIHKIDINGTLVVAMSNLDLWIERNRCKSVLFVGPDSLLENINLERFLNSLV